MDLKVFEGTKEIYPEKIKHNMSREEKCKLLIEKGFTYDPITGKIYGIYGKEITGNADGYIRINLWVNKSNYSINGHTLSWYIINNEICQIDHINGDRSDNRILNLRSVTTQQNNWNRTKSKGYSWSKPNNKYKACIKINGKTKHIGFFDTEQEAHQSYLDAKKIYHTI